MRSAVDQSKNQSLIFGTTKMNCTLNRNESVFNCVISSQSTIDKVLTCIRIFPKRVCVGGQDGGNTEIINKSKSAFASNLMPKNTRKSHKYHKIPQNPLSPSQPLSGIIKQALSLTSAGVERLLHDKTNQQLLKEETQNKPQISLRPCSM